MKTHLKVERLAQVSPWVFVSRDASAMLSHGTYREAESAGTRSNLI